MANIKIIPMASGSSGNCMYLEVGAYKFIVDLGISYRRIINILNKNHIDIDSINAIFITHTHSDHIGGLLTTVNNTHINIFSSQDTKGSLKIERIVGLPFNEEIEIDDNFNVTLIPTSHDCLGSCGFIFKYKDIKISYFTDLGYVDETIMNGIKGSNLLIIESNHNIEMLKNGPYPALLKKRILSTNGHLSNDACAKLVKEISISGTKHFLLAHLSKENNTPELAYQEVSKGLNEDIDIRVLPRFFDEMWEIDI